MKTVLFVLILLVLGGFFYFQNRLFNVSTSTPSALPTPSQAASTPAPPAYPLDHFQERLTLRRFGQYITPADQKTVPCGAPFTGFHTGDDLEVFPAEESVPVPVYSATNGTVVEARRVSGYGGLVVVSSEFQGSPVTVYYGHLDLSSVSLKAGDSIKKGQVIGSLGQGCSSQTDGERKHLHFAVHRGSAVDVRGYVPTQKELQNWLDPSLLIH